MLAGGQADSIILPHPKVPEDLKGRLPSFYPLSSTYGQGYKMPLWYRASHHRLDLILKVWWLKPRLKIYVKGQDDSPPTLLLNHKPPFPFPMHKNF